VELVIRTIPGGRLSSCDERQMNVCLTGELARTNILGRLVACHHGLEVQHAPRYSRIDWAGTKPPPRLATTPVRPIEHLRTSRIRDDNRPTGDRPQLFCEEWVVREVTLRLLGKAIGIVELIGTGKLDDFRQRLVPGPPDLRVSIHAPGDAAHGNGEGDDRGDNPPPARYTGPRDGGRLSR
jgi:hypothetical protein